MKPMSCVLAQAFQSFNLTQANQLTPSPKTSASPSLLMVVAYASKSERRSHASSRRRLLAMPSQCLRHSRARCHDARRGVAITPCIALR